LASPIAETVTSSRLPDFMKGLMSAVTNTAETFFEESAEAGTVIP
jgi:hypothetical protein